MVEYLKNNNIQFRLLTWIRVGFKNLLHGTLVFQGRADREYDSKNTKTKRRYSSHSAKNEKDDIAVILCTCGML